MTTLDLALAGLPEMERIPCMDAVEKLGWEVSGLIKPGPRGIWYAYNDERRAFALVVDIVLEPPSFHIVEGTPGELVAWIEEHRPELANDMPETPHNPWGTLKKYATDPEAEARWWQICDDCKAGALSLGVDVGDA